MLPVSFSVKWEDLAPCQIRGKRSCNTGFNDYIPWPVAQHWEHFSGRGRVNSGFPADAKGRECGAQARSPPSLSFLQPRGSAARSSLGHSPRGRVGGGCCLAAGCSPSHDPLIPSSRAFTQLQACALSRARLPLRGGSGYRLKSVLAALKPPRAQRAKQPEQASAVLGLRAAQGGPSRSPPTAGVGAYQSEAEMLPSPVQC